MVKPVITHSLYGQKAGVHKDGWWITQDNDVSAVTSATTGTVIPAGGVTNIGITSTDKVWSLAAPVVGVRKTIIRGTTSTGSTGQVTLASGNILSSANSTGQTITMTGQGLIELMGISTASWLVVGTFGSVVTS
jgi:hypothetical protein